jgi:hypothetical protein
MRMVRACALASAALLIGACVGTQSSRSSLSTQGEVPDLSGRWVLTTDSGMGSEDAEMTVIQTGSKLVGTITSRAGTVDYAGTVQGSVVAFDFVLEIHGADLKLDYSGTIEGDTIKGTTQFGKFGSGTFTARRK